MTLALSVQAAYPAQGKQLPACIFPPSLPSMIFIEPALLLSDGSGAHSQEAPFFFPVFHITEPLQDHYGHLRCDQMSRFRHTKELAQTVVDAGAGLCCCFSQGGGWEGRSAKLPSKRLHLEGFFQFRLAPGGSIGRIIVRIFVFRSQEKSGQGALVGWPLKGNHEETGVSTKKASDANPGETEIKRTPSTFGTPKPQGTHFRNFYGFPLTRHIHSHAGGPRPCFQGPSAWSHPASMRS